MVSLASVGCKSPTADEQMDNVRSWLATADMAAQAWLNHTTPEKYTRQTLELSRENVQQMADGLKKSPAPGVDSHSLDSLLTRSSSRVDRMATLVTSRNSPALRIELDSLRIEERSVHDIAERLKSGQ
jgi:hypothetical protein